MDKLAAAVMYASGTHLVALVGVALLTRALPRFFCPQARGFDAYFHLIAARSIRSTRFHIPRGLKEYLLPGLYDYPPFYHYWVALFPESLHLVVERYSSAALDALHGVLVYLFAIYWIIGFHPTAQPEVVAVWVALLFLMSPALTSVGTGPRAYQGTPRTLGELLFTLAMAAAICYRGGEGPGFLVLAAFFGGCLFLTSKFGVQVYVFFNLFLFVSDGRPIWLFFPAGSFLAAILISFGHYRAVVRGHWEHSRYYRAVIAPRFHMVHNFNRWEDIRNLLRNLVKDPARAAKTLLMDNSYTQLLIKHPQLPYIGYLAVSDATFRATDGLMWGWVGAGLIAFVLTSFKAFRFLGEADRYLEYTLVPQLLLLAEASSFRGLVPVFIVYEVIWYVIFAGIFIVRFTQDARRLPAFREMVGFIRNRSEIQRILPIYLGEANQLAYETGKGILYFPANFRKSYFPYREFESLYERVFPFPAEDLSSVMKRYQLDVVYFSDVDLQKAQANRIQYDFDGWIKVFSNGTYTVLKPPAA